MVEQNKIFILRITHILDEKARSLYFMVKHIHIKRWRTTKTNQLNVHFCDN